MPSRALPPPPRAAKPPHVPRPPKPTFGARRHTQQQQQGNPELRAVDVAMLRAHGLEHWAFADEHVWRTAPFNAWLALRLLDTRDVSECGMHQSKFVPLAKRGMTDAVWQGMPWKFAWTGLFRKVCTMGDTWWRLKEAQKIVWEVEDWAVDAGRPLLALAWICVECVVMQQEGVVYNVAPIVEVLHSTLEERSELHAKVFAELLKRCVWEEFEAWWQPVSSYLIAGALAYLYNCREHHAGCHRRSTGLRRLHMQQLKRL